MDLFRFSFRKIKDCAKKKRNFPYSFNHVVLLLKIAFNETTVQHYELTKVIMCKVWRVLSVYNSVYLYIILLVTSIT